jgi:hypothetical protein
VPGCQRSSLTRGHHKTVRTRSSAHWGKPGCENDHPQTGRGLALAKSLTHRGTSALHVTEANWMPNLFLPDLTRIQPTTGLSLPDVYAQTIGDHGATRDCSYRDVRLRGAGARRSSQLFRNPPNKPPTPVVASSAAVLVIAESVKAAGVPCLLLARSCFSVPGSSSSGVSAARQLETEMSDE